MLRRDFISKIIEQMVNAIARLIKIDIEKEQEQFLEDFDEFLHTYFQLSDADLALLTEENEGRDGLLLNENLKDQLIHLFVNAGLVFQGNQQSEKAKNCLKIIERIQNQHSGVYTFPNDGSGKVLIKIEELKTLLS